MKIKFKNVIQDIFGSPVVRGVIKSLPFGNVAYELGQNISHAIDENKHLVPNENGETEVKDFPHSAISLIAQTVFLGLIIYAFVMKQITIEDILRFVNISDFKNDIPVQNVSHVIDTLN